MDGVAYRPSAQTEAISRRLRTRSVRIRRPSSPSGPKRANPRLLAWLPGSHSCSRGAVCAVFLLLRTRSRRRFRCVKASETFCVLAAYTEAQKVLRASKEPERMRFAVQPDG